MGGFLACTTRQGAVLNPGIATSKQPLIMVKYWGSIARSGVQECARILFLQCMLQVVLVVSAAAHRRSPSSGCQGMDHGL
jgi:hypothetical protein